MAMSESGSGSVAVTSISPPAGLPSSAPKPLLLPCLPPPHPPSSPFPTAASPSSSTLHTVPAMDRLCDEILQIIINELDDPTNFSLTSKGIYAFTQDPYVRATYFISRYGKIQALYWAFGRPRLMNKRVIDILLSSGAHLSRYLVQCVIQQYFRSHVHFIKQSWARKLEYSVATYILTIAGERYGNVPIGKGEDDGQKFLNLLKESRLSPEQRTSKWETLRDILEKYQFIPFCNKDPMMTQFPLVLAIEPRLLPFARANGFSMDRKYRNFVFRKMFERSAVAGDTRTNDIVTNVKQLSSLDSQMFLTRTVAAEICMEAKANEAAYNALKILDKNKVLKFELSIVIQDLIKLFVNTRSVTNPITHAVIRQLFFDYPSRDPTVRVVLLLQVFLSERPVQIITPSGRISYADAYIRFCKDKIESLNLNPVTRDDLFGVLVNRFAPDRFDGVLEYAKRVLDMSRHDLEELARDVAFKCLEIGCKGKMLEKLIDMYPTLDDAIRENVMKHYMFQVDDLPSPENERACVNYEAKLCRDFIMPRHAAGSVYENILLNDQSGQMQVAGHHPQPMIEALTGEDVNMERSGENDDEAMHTLDDESDDIDYIGQDTLSTMIRKDENRGRRRYYDFHTSYNDTAGKLGYPPDYSPMGKFIRNLYGVRSGVSAVFMLHAVANGNPMTVQSPVGFADSLSLDTRIPVTLKHFKILARLGRAPTSSLFDDIEAGAEFFFSEEDYLSPEELSGAPRKVRRRRHSMIKVKLVSSYSIKSEATPGPSRLHTPISSPVGPSRGQKRPRRSVAAPVKSYVVPDSDDDEIVDADDAMIKQTSVQARKRKEESNMQKWIKHLSVLLKEEQKKFNEKKKRTQANLPQGTKVRLRG
ncbi:hypothetical protein QCA50_006641 [Cerrena zonata]|uniref:Uncharacterized protein n=1 Tax=Cerrena zonata TaxID=2478898 RepID=A0AAW0GE25_9APHY